MAAERLHEVQGSVKGLIFRRLTATEELGRPFVIDAELLSESTDISPTDVIGTNMTISIVMKDGNKRHFNGIVSQFYNVGQVGGYQLYQVELRPWFWLLTHTLDCRIFQNLSVVQILEKVFRDTYGFSDFRFAISGSYSAREYCVQYRESAFDFVSRLMEDEGIYYHFEHAVGKHTLILTDSVTKASVISGDGALLYRPPNEVTTGDEHIYHWKHHVALQPAKFALRDYDYEKPKNNLEARQSITAEHPHTQLERYDYPGNFTTDQDGRRVVRLLSEEYKARINILEGKARSFRLSTGKLFRLAEHPREKENATYLVISSKAVVTSGEIEQFTSEAENEFEIEFSALLKSIEFRSARSTPKPIIAGPQTAVVTGKQGDEILVDKLGRVKVQFPWDREGKTDESSSCWIRVGQVWAGKGWGSIHIPRVGQEVIVEFIEGDPDKPIITGRVYNSDQVVPYDLPNLGHQSGIKSRSTKEGTEEHFNELRFEDSKDAELIYFHAEKDFKRIVENSDTEEVGFLKKDPGDQTIKIFNNQVLTIGNDESDEGSQTLEIWKDQTETIKTGNRKVTIESGNDDLVISKGNLKIDVSAGECSISASKKISLTVGSSTLVISPDKIEISSAEIALTATMKAAMSGSMTEVKGSATLDLKGGIVNIN